MLDWGRNSTALALAVLAQEEFSKAFILQLVKEGALPWISEMRQSIRRHHCKHLPTYCSKLNRLSEPFRHAAMMRASPAPMLAKTVGAISTYSGRASRNATG